MRRPARILRPTITDTTPEAKQAQIEATRRMTPSARVAQALDFSETMRRLSLGRLRARHPERTELRVSWIARWKGAKP